MDRIPNTIDIRNFVGEKFDHIQTNRNAQNPRVREHLQRRRQVNDAEAFEQTKSRNGRVKIQPRGKSRAKRQAKSFDRIHTSILRESTRGEELLFHTGPALA